MENKTTDTEQGHWILAKMGKKVLRPAIAMKDLYKHVSKVGLGVVLVLTVGSASPVFGARQSMANDPSRVVYQLYKEFGWVAYFSLQNDAEQRLGGTILVQPRAILSRFFDENLTRLIEKEAACEKKNKGELCNLEFDPLFGTQDTQVTELTLIPKDSNKVLVEYIFPSNQSKIKIEYQLQKAKAGWRISDVVYLMYGRDSLKALLSKR